MPCVILVKRGDNASDPNPATAWKDGFIVSVLQGDGTGIGSGQNPATGFFYWFIVTDRDEEQLKYLEETFVPKLQYELSANDTRATYTNQNVNPSSGLGGLTNDQIQSVIDNINADYADEVSAGLFNNTPSQFVLRLTWTTSDNAVKTEILDDSVVRFQSIPTQKRVWSVNQQGMQQLSQSPDGIITDTFGNINNFLVSAV